MLEFIGRLLPGGLLCGLAGALCWTYFTDRDLRRDRGDPTSFFYPAQLVSRSGLRAYRCLFAGSLTLLLFIGYITTTSDDATLNGLNAYLLRSLVQVTPGSLADALGPVETFVLGHDFGAATRTIRSLALTTLVALVALVFTPHLIIAYRLARAKFQQLIDANALIQARATAHVLAAGNPALALEKLKLEHPNLILPPEVEGADPELKLTIALLTVTANTVPEKGISGALAAIRGEVAAASRYAVDPKRLAATAFIYVIGCILYIGIVPQWSTVGPDGPKLTVQTRWFCYTCDWIAYRADSLRDLGLQIMQFSSIVVAPFLIGLYFYNSRRRRIPTEPREAAIREVLSSLFWLPLAASVSFIILEALRFHFQAHRGVPTDLPASLLRNAVQDMLMSCIPLLLVWIWARLLDTKSSLVMLGVLGPIVAALCCSGIQTIFEAMLYAEDGKVTLAFGPHAALLGFYLVCLVGLSALLFLPEMLRSEADLLAVKRAA